MSSDPTFKNEIQSEFIEVHGDQYEVIILKENISNKRLIVVDPLTWSWVAIAICEGIISYVGSQIFSRIIGEKSLTKKDLNELINEFVSLVSAVIRIQLDANEKAKLDASASSLQSLFTIYQNNKDISFIIPLLFKADEILHQSERLGLLTVPCFAITGSIELAILQELYLVKRNKGDKINIRDKALLLIDKATKLRPNLEKYNTSRFGELLWIDVWDGTRIYHYALDGQTQFIPRFTGKDPVKIRNDHITREFDRLERTILYGIYPVIDKWRKISELTYPK